MAICCLCTAIFTPQLGSCRWVQSENLHIHPANSGKYHASSSGSILASPKLRIPGVSMSLVVPPITYKLDAVVVWRPRPYPSDTFLATSDRSGFSPLRIDEFPTPLLATNACVY